MRKKATVKISKFIMIIVAFLFLAAIAKLSYIVLSDKVDGIDLQQMASSITTVKKTLYANRGNIFDVNGEKLATTVNSYNVIAYLAETRTTDADNPRHVVDKEKTAAALAPLLNMSEERILELLNKDLYQTQLGPGGNDITEVLKNAIEELALPGIGFESSSKKRYYRNSSFAAYIIGYAKKNDNNELVGELGIEGYFNDVLAGTNGYTQYLKYTSSNYKIPNTPEDTVEAIDGADIYLTIDFDIQKLAEKASLNEVSLQRDIALSERDMLREQLKELKKTVEDIKEAEDEVLNRVAKIAEKEVAKIKSAVKDINVPLKKKGLYFNVLANDKRKSGSGGPYIPNDNSFLRDTKVSDKISQIFGDVDDLEYYKEVLSAVPLGKPVWSFWVSSPHGWRNDPFRKTKVYHKGIDMAARTGNKIKVMAKGKVIRAGTASGYGKLVEIDHGNGFKTKYGHMNKIYVEKGQYVEAGDEVGEVGNTGRSTGPHLHYEILYKGHDVDPMPFMKAKIS